MKHFLLLLSFFLCVYANAQVAISNPATNPDPSAMLDVRSTNRGFLMPRVANRNDVASPAVGLMIYETATNSVLVNTNSGWTPLGSGGGGSSQWLANATHIYNGNAGNVGVGINLPTSKLHLVGNMKQDNGIIVLNNSVGEINFQNAGVDKAFMQLSGNNLRLGTVSANDPGRFIVRTNAGDRLIVDSTGNVQILGLQDASLTSHGYLTIGNFNSTNLIFDNNELMARNDGGPADLIMQNDGGNVGIGTSPDERIDVAGNAKLKGGAPLIKMEAAVGGTGSPFASQRYTPGIQFLRQGTSTVLGKMEYVDTANHSNFLRFYTGAIASHDLTISTSHNVGIGNADPVAKLHVVGADELLRLHSLSDPIMQFTTGFIGTPAKKGFIDVNANDFRIGTNSENDAGKFIVRVNGGDVVNVTPTYNVGIGTAAPTAKLHVVGKIFANAGGEAIRIEGTDPAINFFQSGTQRGYVYNTGNDMQIGTSNAAGRLFLNANKVQISTSVALPDGYRLGVGGKVLCEELKVKLQSSGWPDYVFSNNYKLMPLKDLQNFISVNNHLPNIPKASVIEKEGLEVGEMQRKLMEKVEELTLYILDLQKQIDELKAKK